MRWLLLIAFLSSGCAARLVTVGQVYLVQWPEGQQDVVEIHRDYGRGWTQCRGVTSNVVYTCNLNTAWWWVRVTQQPEPPAPGTRTD